MKRRVDLKLAIGLFAILLSFASAAREPIEGALPHPLVPILPDGYISYDHDYDYVEVTILIPEESEGNDRAGLARHGFNGFRKATEYAHLNQDNFVRLFRSYIDHFESIDTVNVAYSASGRSFWNDLPGLSDQHNSILYRDVAGLKPASGHRSFDEKGLIILTPADEGQEYDFITISFYRSLINESRMRILVNQFKYDAVNLLQLPEVDSSPPNKSELESDLQQDGRAVVNAILFEFDSDVLMDGSEGSINVLVSLLQENPELRLYVVGHTDWVGSYDYNLDLSKARATAVVNRLITAHGIDRGRLIPVGVGPVAPVTSNETEEGRALNRRVEIVNFK